MNSYENYYKNLCRVCLNQGNNKMVPLIQESSTNGLSCYGIALCKFVNISVRKDDNLPMFMCQNCLYLLKEAIKLKLICESSDKRLNCVVQSINKGCINRENVMKEVSENVLYGTFFSKILTRPKTKLTIAQKADDCNKNVKYDILESQSPGETLKYDSEDNINMKNIYKTKKDILKTKLIRKTKCLKKKKYITKPCLVKRDRKKNKNGIPKRNVVCELCNKVLASPMTLKHHMQRHSGGRFMCEYCAKHYPTYEELRIHLVCTHGTGRYMQCSKCDFKAPRKKELREHERLHTGERPFACDKCGLTFRTRYIWKKHSVYHEERAIQCIHCPRKFHLRSEMKAHINNIHERQYMYMCNHCGAMYARTQTVRRHLTEKHGVAREMQGRIKRVLKGKDMEFPEQ